MGLPKGAVLLLRLITGFIRMFVLDSRSLALFRVWIGATTIADVWTRFPDAHHHYSDSGMFPREFILKSFTNHYWITMHMLSGTEFVMQCLFIVEIFIAFLLLVGYRTRTMNILSWIMVCSVQNRNYVLGHSGDTVHRLFLFVGIFLPLSRVFSVDRVLECIRTSRDCDDLDRDREREKRRLGLAGLTSSPANGGSATSSSSSSSSCAKYEIVNFATALFIVQLLIMYYMAHHHKTGAEWREKGIAAWMALQLDYFRTWFGDLLLIWTPGLIFGNYAVLAWQYWGSVMYFSPIFNKYFRALTCLGFTAMHVGFGMAFYLETFTWATLAACSGIIPSWVWDLTIKFISNLPFFKPIQIHVTSNCKTCLFVARLLDEFSLPGKSKIIIASSRLSSSSSQSCLCSSKCSHGSRFLGISVLDQNKNWIQGPAALSAIAKNSPILYPLHFVLRIPFVQKILSFVSFATHSHNLEFSNSDSAMEEATIDTSKFSYRPHFESFEKFEKFERDTKKDDDVLALPRNEEFVGVLVDSNSPNINTNTGKGKKEIFEVQSASYNWADVKEASKIGFIAGKEIFVALLLFLVITCNAGHLNNQYGVPPPLQPILWMFQLDQYWGMFAPRPPDITWWYNFEGYLDDGTHVELFNNGAMHSFSPNIPHTFDKPNIHDSIGNHRWFKLFENGLNSHSNREEIRLYFGRWFCREYNSRNKGTKRVHKYSIHFMYERLNLEKMDGSRFPPARESIWNHLCYEKDKN